MDRLINHVEGFEREIMPGTALKKVAKEHIITEGNATNSS